MRRIASALLVVLVAALAAAWRPAFAQATRDRADLERIVSAVVVPLMQRQGIPGMAVGVVVDGRREVFDFGVASKVTKRPVDATTLFEIGSISKTFTATLASYAHETGALSLSDPVSRCLPSLRGSAFDRVNALNLGTHTTGGLPLQLPDGVRTERQLIAYFRQWTPTTEPGTTRGYGNPGIALLGRCAAASLHGDFARLMERDLFPALGLKDTFIDVPRARMRDYAQGHTDRDVPIRMAPGVIAAEAYGVRTTADDLLRFVEAQMQLRPLDARWQRAVDATHTGYYRVGAMTQDLVWEQYADTVTLADLVAGNAPGMIFEPNAAIALDPPSPPRDDVLINKTGSTNGFSAYVLFVPARRIGVVLLANKSDPIEIRVTAGRLVLDGLSRR